MNRIATRAGIVLILALLLIAGFGFFVTEYVINAQDWVVSEGSSHFDERGGAKAGTVMDRDGTFLLDLSEKRTYSETQMLRKALLHWLGDRDGYIFAPLLSGFDEEMLGYDLMTGTYTYGSNAGKAQLTLSGKVQQAALEAMGSYKGTVAVYNYKTGQLLCSVTTPTYDPDDIPENLEADPAYKDAYYNKFTQFTYTPGSIFKVVTLAAAIEELEDLPSMEFSCSGSYLMGVDTVTCTGVHGKQNIQAAFRNSCNCAFAQLSQALGGETLARYVDQFRVTQSIDLDGITTAKGNFEADPSAVNVAWSAIGQFTDQINPCAFLNFIGAVANGGFAPDMYLMERVSVESKVTYQAQTRYGPQLMSEDTARLIREYMRSNVADKYGDDHFPGLTVCAKTGTGEVGGDRKPNAMLTGFAMDQEYPLAFIVCVEDGGFGSTVCMPIASKVLAACKEVLDAG